MWWIYTRSFNRNIYGSEGTLKSFGSLFWFILSYVKFSDRFQVSFMFIHWTHFSLIVKQYQILKDHFFCQFEMSSYLNILKSPYGSFWCKKVTWGHGPRALPPSPPIPCSYAPEKSLLIISKYYANINTCVKCYNILFIYQNYIINIKFCQIILLLVIIDLMIKN